MTEPWFSIVSLILWIVVPIIVFVARHWIIARVTKGVQHHFDEEIEKLRGELRKSEEEYKSELRKRESEIATLRENVLAGSAGRQTLFDKRRFEAVEKVWIAVNDFAALKSLSASMAVLNYKEVAKNAADPRMQTFLSIMGGNTPEPSKIKNGMNDLFYRN